MDIANFAKIAQDKGKFLQFIESRGPILPVDLAKAMKIDSMFAGAILSELLSNKQIKISTAKIGGSPVYYTKGQESKLDILYDHLHEKARRTYDILKEDKVLKDKEVGPVERTALRELKDFAVMLNVTAGEEELVFWKWHLLPDNEAATIIKKKLGLVKEEKTPPKPEPIVKEEKIEPPKPIPEPKKPEIKKLEPKIEKQKQLSPTERTITENDDFLHIIKSYFENNNITVHSTEVIRKNSDVELIIEIPSVFGELQYFCKAKNKKKCNDGDLSSAFIRSQSLKLPIIFLTTGEITKRAQEMLDKEFKGMTLKKL